MFSLVVSVSSALFLAEIIISTVILVPSREGKRGHAWGLVTGELGLLRTPAKELAKVSEDADKEF